MKTKILLTFILSIGLFALINAFMVGKFVLTEYNIPIETLTKKQQDVYYGLIWIAIISLLIAIPSIFLSVKFLLINKKK